MATTFDDAQLSNAVLQHIESNAYPDSQELTSADLPSSAVHALLGSISEARQSVKSEIRALGNNAADDVDGWIAQAKKIQADIETSKATARNIVQEAEQAKKLEEEVQDAAGKVTLLEKELVYNESVAETLGSLKRVVELLRKTQDAAVKDDIGLVLSSLVELDTARGGLHRFENARIAGVLQRQSDQLRSAAVESVKSSWHSLIAIDRESKTLKVSKEANRQKAVDLDSIVSALASLDLLEEQITQLSGDILRVFVVSRLKPNNGRALSLNVVDDTLIASGEATNANATHALADMQTMIDYLNTRLPRSISNALSTQLMPQANILLISELLEPSLPMTIDGLHTLHAILTEVSELRSNLESIGWYGSDQLSSWLETIPSVWLGRRREAALLEVRKQCQQGSQRKQVVERVETQMIATGDALAVPQQQTDDDWGAEWDDDNSPVESQKKAHKPSDASEEAPEDEDEDADAWGWGEGDEKQEGTEPTISDAPTAIKSSRVAKQDEDAEDADAWGWGDEEASNSAQPSPIRARKASHHDPAAQQPVQTNGGERAVTLRETYTVTAIPTALLQIIKQVVQDVESLHRPEFAESPVQQAAMSLYMIPPLVLAMYRATASNHYTVDPAGNMLLYNDCMRLTDELNSYLQEQNSQEVQTTLPPGMRPSDQLILTNDISAIESFGKRAYGREMESQRTIIRDHLDGAQGFANCTEQPFARECESAVDITVDWLKELNKQWLKVLSHSARLQSLGSLLKTALAKMIMDIEDLSDISQEESKQLVKLCRRISEVNMLFAQEGAPDGEGNLVGMYTPNWYKFQWLIEILEGSLADIKYQWEESDLRLEFQGDEVVDLIEALFADSEHRRKAINQIRRLTR